MSCAQKVLSGINKTRTRNRLYPELQVLAKGDPSDNPLGAAADCAIYSRIALFVSVLRLQSIA